jgi:hypothetical protein
MAVQVALAAVLLAIAAYAHYRIPFHTAGRRSVVLTRAFLVISGIVVGGVAAVLMPDRQAAVVAFVQGFGVLHVPAALSLLLKRARHEGRS